MPEVQAVVALRATRRRSRIAKIAQHESPPASVRVRVLLHHVELRRLGATTAVERVPVDRPSIDGRRPVGHHHTLAHTRPDEELSALERVEQRAGTHRAAHPGRQIVEVDHGTFGDASSRGAPHCAQQVQFERCLAAQLRANPLRRRKESHARAVQRSRRLAHGARVRQHPECRLRLPVGDLSVRSPRESRGIEPQRSI